ncbi:MAG: hypothetical protein PHH00_03725 [Candidatus Nanoarchaeia archaeon]|nr:hypothetical protein [Candidatus Nanoarchaeia archaeon]
MLGPVDKARELERDAHSRRRGAYSTSDEGKRYARLSEAARMYEQAGNTWMRELTASKGYERRMEYARQNAHKDYQLGRTIRKEMKEGGLGRKVAGVAAMISLVGALASISMNLTGNAIGSSLENNSWISIGLFFLGCVFTMFYFRMKEKNVGKKKKRR